METVCDEAFIRYQRQISLTEIGEEGQKKLIQSHVLVIGCGGLGTTASLLLAGAGIGSLTLVDDDDVEVSNLHRQIAYRETDLGFNKAEALKQQLSGLNHRCRIRAIPKRMTDEQLGLELMLADCVVDCSDNLITRFQLNEACFRQKKCLVSASVIGWKGQLARYSWQDEQPCYACLNPPVPGQAFDKAASCRESGVAGPVVSMMASMQALSVIQFLLKMNEGNPEDGSNQLLCLDGMTMQIKSFQFGKNPACPVCGSESRNGIES